MQRSRQPNPWRMMIILAVTWAAGSLLFAAETPTPPAAQQGQPAEQVPTESTDPGADEPQAAPAETANSEEATPAEETQDPAAQAAAKPPEKKDAETQRQSAADKGSSPQRFVPSEQVRADFDVSFPIDI